MSTARAPRGWAPEPGTSWVGCSGAVYVTTRMGFLAKAGDDNPTAVWEPHQVWASDGPLIAAPRLAAQLRREAHELSCRHGAGCADGDDAALLLDRADRLAS